MDRTLLLIHHPQSGDLGRSMDRVIDDAMIVPIMITNCMIHGCTGYAITAHFGRAVCDAADHDCRSMNCSIARS